MLKQYREPEMIMLLTSNIMSDKEDVPKLSKINKKPQIIQEMKQHQLISKKMPKLLKADVNILFSN
jgi:hypothetical protein